MQDQFKKLQDKYPSLSTIMVFVKMIRNKRITDFELRKWFDILVDKSDWKGTPINSVLQRLTQEIKKIELKEKDIPTEADIEKGQAMAKKSLPAK